MDPTYEYILRRKYNKIKNEKGNLQCNHQIFVEELIVDKIQLGFFSLKYLYKINATNRYHHVVHLFSMVNQDASITIDVQRNLMYDFVLMLLLLVSFDVL